MPKFGPISRKELVYYLRRLNFDGPYSGGKHQFMIKGALKIRIPNPHAGNIGKNLLSQILTQAEIDKKAWEEL
jgi:hypothetical protein